MCISFSLGLHPKCPHTDEATVCTFIQENELGEDVQRNFPCLVPSFVWVCLFLFPAARALKTSLTDGFIQDISEIGREQNY